MKQQDVLIFLWNTKKGLMSFEFFNFIFSSIWNSLLFTRIFRPSCHNGRDAVNGLGRGAALKLTHCNGRMFQKPSWSHSVDLLAFCWPDYFHEEKFGCWEEALPNGDAMKKISYFLLMAPHQAESCLRTQPPTFWRN